MQVLAPGSDIEQLMDVRIIFVTSIFVSGFIKRLGKLGTIMHTTSLEGVSAPDLTEGHNTRIVKSDLCPSPLL